MCGVLLGSIAYGWQCVIVIGAWLPSVIVCARAERELGQHDAPQIILDEVWAMTAIVVGLAQMAPNPSAVWWSFLAFRFFDITKPPPLRWLARLPAGWGIMADDAGAAVYTLLLCWMVH